MIQLFLTLRQARQSIAMLTSQVEPSLRLFNEIAQKPRPDPAAGSQLASIVAAVVPAAISAYRAFRQQQREENHASSMIGQQDLPGPAQSVGHHGREMETENERPQ
jgi:hypothetical protein